jgi:hypothetical protein
VHLAPTVLKLDLYGRCVACTENPYYTTVSHSATERVRDFIAYSKTLARNLLPILVHVIVPRRLSGASVS